MKYKEWKDEFYSSIVGNDKVFVCCQCMCGIKHKIWHWLRWHSRCYEE